MKNIVFYVILFVCVFLFAEERDIFGYSVTTSINDGNLNYNWIVPNTQNEILDLPDEGESDAVPIGFSFDFYGIEYDSLYVGSNGTIYFDSGSYNYENQFIPDPSEPNNLIAWFWDDLNPSYIWAEEHIYYQNLTLNNMSAFMVTFVDYPEYGSGGSAPDNCLTAQVILFSNGDILINYNYFGDDVDKTSSTIGIENESGVDGLLYRYNSSANTPELNNEMSIKFKHPDPFSHDLRAVSITGPDFVPVGQNAFYNVRVKNVGLNQESFFDIELRLQNNNFIFASITDDNPFNPQEIREYSISFVPESELLGERQIFAKVNLTGDENNGNNITDVITTNITTQYDFSALSITGENNPLSNVPESYKVRIKNIGVSQNNTIVKILDNDSNVLGETVVTDAISWLEEVDVDIFLYLTEDVSSIRAKVIAENDSNNSNNFSPLLDINVQPSQNNIVQVGNGNEISDFMPFKNDFKKSVTQTLYLSDSFTGNLGTINQIRYNYNSLTVIDNQPLQIYATTTDLSELSSWIETSEFTEVFNGFININSGENELVVSFDSPYYFTGDQNLCLMIVRNSDIASEELNFKISSSTSNVTRSYFSDNSDLNLENLPTEGVSNLSSYPNCRFFISSESTICQISGIVRENNGLLSNVNVTLSPSGINSVSDNNGFYYFGDVQPGNYQLTFERFGYENVTSNIIVSEGQLLMQYTEMEEFPTITIGGTILNSENNNIEIEGASINLSGYSQVSTVSDNLGFFVLPNIYGEHQYELLISKNGYQDYSYSFYAEDVDINLNNIYMVEQLLAVTNVCVGYVNDRVSLTWDYPNGRPITSFKVYRLFVGDEENSNNWIYLDTTNVPYFVEEIDSNIIEANYKYAIVAVYNNSSNSEPAFSSMIHITTPHLPPSNFYFNIGDVSLNQVIFYWTAPEGDVSHYKFYFENIYYTNINDTTIFFNGMVEDATHIAGVSAVYDDGVESDIVSITFLFTNNECLDSVETSLSPNYPNPFNPKTLISFNVAKGDFADLCIYNLQGRLIKNYGKFGFGKHKRIWEGKDDFGNSVGSGVYFYRLKSQKNNLIKKMILIK